jgi:hypothetical protein
MPDGQGEEVCRSGLWIAASTIAVASGDMMVAWTGMLRGTTRSSLVAFG